MSEKHLPFIGGNFDRIVFERDNSSWVKEEKLREQEEYIDELESLLSMYVEEAKKVLTRISDLEIENMLLRQAYDSLEKDRPMHGTNWEKYFGTAGRAAENISLLVDRCDSLNGNEDFHSEFTDHFDFGGDCEYGLVHTDTLRHWLEKEIEVTTLGVAYD